MFNRQYNLAVFLWISVMNKKINEIGNKYGRLTVIAEAVSNRRAKWYCLCDCKNTVVVLGKSLRNGATQSCGCFRKEREIEGGQALGRKKIAKDINRPTCCNVMCSKWGKTRAGTRQWKCRVCLRYFTYNPCA